LKIKIIKEEKPKLKIAVVDGTCQAGNNFDKKIFLQMTFAM
jgi:hypothetical protein